MSLAVNTITNPPNFTDTLETRFINEWRRTEEAIRINNLIQWGIIGAAFIVNGLLIAVVFHAPPVAGEVFTLMCLVNAAMLKWYASYSTTTRIDKVRINGGIFEEVLIAPDRNGHRNISPEKINIFVKYGDTCRTLRISHVMYPERGNFSNYMVFSPCITVSRVCDWAIKFISERAKVRLEDPYDPNNCTIELLKNAKRLHGDEMISLHGHKLGSLSNAMLKVHEYVARLQRLMPLPQGEGAEEAYKSAKEENDRIKKDLETHKKSAEEAFKGQFSTRFDVESLAKVIAACPNLQTLAISAEFEIKELFGDCEGARAEQDCPRHNRFRVINTSNDAISVCALRTLDQIWADRWRMQLGIEG